MVSATGFEPALTLFNSPKFTSVSPLLGPSCCNTLDSPRERKSFALGVSGAGFTIANALINCAPYFPPLQRWLCTLLSRRELATHFRERAYGPCLPPRLRPSLRCHAPFGEVVWEKLNHMRSRKNATPRFQQMNPNWNHWKQAHIKGSWLPKGTNPTILWDKAETHRQLCGIPLAISNSATLPADAG